MSYEPSVLSGHRVGELNRSYAGTGNSTLPTPIVNGGPASRPDEGEKKRNFKLLIDPVLKGRGHQKIYRFDGHFEGQAPVVPKDPRSRRTRLWSTRTKADLPLPKFKIDKFYVGIPPQRDIILNGLNDNVDRKFLHQICEKFGNIEGVKIFYDPLTKRHLGKARVGFSTSASAKLAVAKLEGTSIMGCIVHADLEHKVEIKPPSKTLAGPQGTTSVSKTSPSTERTITPHVLPTPPPSASSQSPISTATPSTPGFLGLMDPRTRGHSTSSVGTEKLGSTSPLQANQSNHKVPVFEPISPPCERVKLPPPPPPDAPPPTTPAKRYSPIPPTPGDRHQDTSTKQGKDLKGSHSKTSRDSYRNNRQSEKDYDWRRRDRESSRDRRDYSSSRSRWDDRGSSYYSEKESRYSSHKEYSSRGRSGGESRNGYGKNDNRKSSSRDNDSKRRRDSDESCSSEKSGKSWKPVNEPSSGGATESMDVKDGRTKVGSSEKPKESAVSSVSVEPLSKGTSSLNASLGDELNKLPGSALSILVNAPQKRSTSHNTMTENGDHGQSHSSTDCLAKQKLEEDGPSIGSVLKEHGSVGGSLDHGINTVNAESTSISIAADVKNSSDLLGCLAEQGMKSKSGSGNLQKGDIGYYPEVEDISPVSSPNAAKTSTTTNETVVPNSSTVTSDSRLELSEEPCVNKDAQVVTEDDDAMSLSSISSNEETLEVAKPERVQPITVPPPTIPFPPFVPPPFIPHFDPTVPPPSMAPLSILPPPLPIAVPPPPIQNLAPPHPLVPPSFHPTYPPQFPSTITAAPPLPVQPQYQPYPSGHLQPSHEQRPTQKKTWKAKISEECLRIVSKELELILKRDVNKRLVENSAFKALDGWWDNLGKTKLKTVTQQVPVPVVSQSPLLSPVNQADMTSSPLFPTSMNQSGGLGIGLRASLPKMPSFRKRPPPSSSGSELYAKRKREDSSSETDTKDSRAENEFEVSGQNDSINSYQSKREEIGDSIDGPPAMSVRIEEKHPTPGSSLYTNIYSSISESGSSVGGDESESESSREDSDWDDSEGSDLSSQSASDFSSDEDDETKRSDGQKSEMVSGIPRTPPGTPPDTPPESPPAPRTPSITPPASPLDSQLVTTEESEGPKVEGVKRKVNDGDMWSTGTNQEDDMKMDYSSSEPEKSDNRQELVTAIEGEKVTAWDESMRDDTESHILQKVEPKSEGPTLPILQDSDSAQSVTQELKSPVSEKTDSQQMSRTMDTIPEPVPKPVFEMPPEFPPRPYIQDDQLVFDFLVSGLDYEDASYLKIGFERLMQVGSDSIADAHWAFHPTTSTGIPTKGRKQKSDNCGVRLHNSGSARCEGYYELSMAEKAKYLEAARRQLDRTQAVDNKKTEEKEANKAKQQSRENRALQRRLAASFQNEDFGDILKFNQLKVRKKKLTFCKSRIHDWGLFALEPIGPDEMVIEYVGEVVRQTIADHREKLYERVGIGSSYLFRVDTDTIIDATKYGNLARFINHCCEPNCYAKVVTLESEKKIVIYSKRDIAVNEEITYDYKFPIEDDKIPCLCGAAQCRGTLN